MGNVFRKPKQGPIDGGVTKQTTTNEEYDQNAVHRLILNRKIAPFYEGLADPASPSASTSTNDSISQGSLIDFSGPSDIIERERPRKQKSILRKKKQSQDEKKESRKKEKNQQSEAQQAELEAFFKDRRTECPICFLNYPRNTNQTECCQQNICTSCFVNMRRPPSGRTMSCPFCNNRDFGIRYKSPLYLMEERRIATTSERSPNNNSLLKKHKIQTVKSESIRPYRPPVPPSRPASSAYRVATTRYAPYGGPPFTTRSGGRTTTYGGGVLVVYNERGQPIYYPQPPRYQPQRSAAYQPYRPAPQSSTQYASASSWYGYYPGESYGHF